jgi:hypothetical protein
MKTVNALVGVLGLTGLSYLTQAQSQSPLNLRLHFNTELNRYEVYVKPTFSAQRYTWGPSQVTVVVPKELADITISPHSSQAGVWLDQSVVYSPAAAPDRDFHAFSTQGGKVDLVAGEEQLLFEFTLAKGYLEGVRLFDPAKDPGSAAPGMKGGDFSSYASNDKGDVKLGLNTRPAELPVAVEAVRSTGAEPGASFGVVAYPNPSVSGVFRLHLKGIPDKEVVQVQMATLNGKVLKQFDESVETLAGRAIPVPGGASTYLLVTVLRLEKREAITQKVLVK